MSPRDVQTSAVNKRRPGIVNEYLASKYGRGGIGTQGDSRFPGGPGNNALLSSRDGNTPVDGAEERLQRSVATGDYMKKTSGAGSTTADAKDGTGISLPEVKNLKNNVNIGSDLQEVRRSPSRQLQGEQVEVASMPPIDMLGSMNNLTHVVTDNTGQMQAQPPGPIRYASQADGLTGSQTDGAYKEHPISADQSRHKVLFNEPSALGSQASQPKIEEQVKSEKAASPGADVQADGARSPASAQEPAPDLDGVQQAWQAELQATEQVEPQPKSLVSALPVADLAAKEAQ